MEWAPKIYLIAIAGCMFWEAFLCKNTVLAKNTVCDEYTRSAGPENCRSRVTYAVLLAPICDENEQSRVTCALVLARFGDRKRHFQPKTPLHDEYTRSAGPEKRQSRVTYALLLGPRHDANQQSRVTCALILTRFGDRKLHLQPKITPHE